MGISSVDIKTIFARMHECVWTFEDYQFAPAHGSVCTCLRICKRYRKPVSDRVWITEFVWTTGKEWVGGVWMLFGNRVVMATKTIKGVGVCPHGSFHNLYFVHLCASLILTPDLCSNNSDGAHWRRGLIKMRDRLWGVLPYSSIWLWWALHSI